jgi:tricorn protease
MSQGYYSCPTIWGEKLVFVCEEDLWLTTIEGGHPQRLTAGRGGFLNAFFSADGKQLAVTTREDGLFEAAVMPAQGGPLKRLSFLNFQTVVRGWQGKDLLLSTGAKNANWVDELYSVSAEGGELKDLGVGLALRQSISAKGDVVIERNGWRPDASHWKRYRGGTAGKFYLKKIGAQKATPFLRNLKGNLSCPHWIGERLYFLSDHEGVGRVYSVSLSGKDVRAHSHETEYYARNLNSDGKRLVYQSGGELYCYTPGDKSPRHIGITLHSQRSHAQTKWLPAVQNLETASVSPTGQSIVLTARGQVLVAPAWQGGVQSPSRQGMQKYRDRLGVWLKESHDSRQIAFVTDEALKTESESLVVVDLKKPNERRILKSDIGRVASLYPSPDGEKVALINHRNEVLVVELKTDKTYLVLQDSLGLLREIDWSGDSQWIVFAHQARRGQQVLSVWDMKSKKTRAVTRPGNACSAPRWSHCGKMIFFLAANNFNPKYETERFSLYFEHHNRPYALLLKSDVASPLRWKPDLPQPAPTNTKETKPQELSIDFGGIEDRVVTLPVREAEYVDLVPLEKGVLLAIQPLQGARPEQGPGPTPTMTIDSLDFLTWKQKQVMSGVNAFRLSPKHDYVLLKIGERLRLRKASDIGTEDANDNDAHPKSGWIFMDRFQVEVHPENEWQQIFQETWRLQKLFYWEKSLGGVDWEAQRKKYQKLLSKVAMRSELTDILWELIGELGVGHAYASGGDIRTPTLFKMGYLGADFVWEKGWKISKILTGYPWRVTEQSPLKRGDVQLQVGDVITAVNGTPVSAERPINQMLLGHAGVDIVLTVKGKKQGPRDLVVRTLMNEGNMRYRHWVETNRQRVHAESKGKLGYIHIPDMGPDGYAEFYEQYLQEHDRDGLVIDVRFNGGGHVSGLVLSKLVQKRVGVDQTRWFGVTPYPFDAPRGPMVGLTNEYAGSDGDIFSHSFKLYKLGPLLGMRTWGGVIGIWPRHQLMDGGSTTQPEFAFWFQDVGWGVENYGTDPDVEVDNLPFSQGDDQLTRAIKEGLAEIKRRPPFDPKLPPAPKRRA